MWDGGMGNWSYMDGHGWVDGHAHVYGGLSMVIWTVALSSLNNISNNVEHGSTLRQCSYASDHNIPVIGKSLQLTRRNDEFILGHR